MSKIGEIFERDFDCEFAIPVGSGTTGISLILKAVGARGKKVILPALTCPNVAIAIFAAKAIPVAVDVSRGDANIEVDAVREAMDGDVAAVVAVDTFGYPAAVADIENIAARYDCAVIEDACQAYGGMVGERAIGSRGRAGVISFGYSKPLDLGGGGMVLTNDVSIAAQIEEELGRAKYRLCMGFKGRLALNLMLQSRNRLLVALGKLGLYQYHMSEGMLQKLVVHWRQFKDSLSDLKSAIFRASDILLELRGAEQFEYRGREWLPWRYSFKMPDPDMRSRFVGLSRGLRLPLSSLYRPMVEHLGTVNSFGSLDTTSSISRCILNLKYSMELESVKEVVEKLGDVRRMWG